MQTATSDLFQWSGFIGGVVTTGSVIWLAVQNVGARRATSAFMDQMTAAHQEAIEALRADKASHDDVVASEHRVLAQVQKIAESLGRFEESFKELLKEKVGVERHEGQFELIKQTLAAFDGRIGKIETAMIEKASGHRVANVEQRLIGIEEELRIRPRHARGLTDPSATGD